MIVYSFIFLLVVTEMFAQNEKSTGTITGIVVHSTSQEPIIGANIFIIGTKIGTTTNQEGKFSIKNIPVGTYQVRVSNIGYSSFVKTDVVVSVAKPAEITVLLEESELKLETTEVTANYFSKNSDTPISTQAQSNEEIGRAHV